MMQYRCLADIRTGISASVSVGVEWSWDCLISNSRHLDCTHFNRCNRSIFSRNEPRNVMKPKRSASMCNSSITTKFIASSYNQSSSLIDAITCMCSYTLYEHSVGELHAPEDTEFKRRRLRAGLMILCCRIFCLWGRTSERGGGAFQIFIRASVSLSMEIGRYTVCGYGMCSI